MIQKSNLKNYDFFSPVGFKSHEKTISMAQWKATIEEESQEKILRHIENKWQNGRHKFYIIGIKCKLTGYSNQKADIW